MPRPSLDNSLTRRAQVAALELRGAAPAAIARELHADARTIQRDLRAIAQERASLVDIASARLRLLAAAQLVELESWGLYQRLPPDDANGKLGALGKVLAAQERQALLLGHLELAGLTEDVAALKEQVAQLVAERSGLRRVGP